MRSACKILSELPYHICSRAIEISFKQNMMSNKENFLTIS